jgi:DNA mismatch repair protein MutL
MQKSKIKLLPDHVANQIAAGEVVQRPASVVKELLENALDAGASQIKLIVKDGGKTLIQVIDNGSGMNPIDARMSLERHATSKISSADDLFAIQTKGFRGEALASIVAVSHMELKTRTEEEELGTYIKIEGSKIITQEPISTPKGTIISVKNLFYNIPARRKFLKSVQVEMKHINDEFIRVALAHPDISFSLIHNGTVIYQLPKANTLQRISNIFGNKMKSRLIPVQEKTPYIKIEGYIGRPDSAKLKRGEQFFFVNNRFIKSSYLNHALMSAYEGLIKDKSFPPYFIFFEIDPQHIDVNIHPTKTEIKFDDEPTVYSILKVAAKHSLGQYNLSPSIDFDRKPDLEIPYEQTKSSPKLPHIEIDPDFNPFETDFTNTKEFSPKHFEKKTQYFDTLMNQTEDFHSKLPLDSHENLGFKQIENIEGIQFLNKFIISTFQGELLVIHQQRAHEFILYHQFLEQSKNQSVTSQKLVFPIELEFQKNEINLLKTIDKQLEQSGFNLDFGEDIILVNGIPGLTVKINIPEFFEELIDKLSINAPLNKLNIKEEIALLLAKKGAIKTGQKLEQNSIEVLLKDLFNFESFAFTPDNKRILYKITEKEIQNQLNK